MPTVHTCRRIGRADNWQYYKNFKKVWNFIYRCDIIVFKGTGSIEALPLKPQSPTAGAQFSPIIFDTKVSLSRLDSRHFQTFDLHFFATAGAKI